MSDNVNSVLDETINNDKSGKTISTIASEILTPFGLNTDKFVYAETICWLREKLQCDVVLSGKKYYVLSETATTEDLFKLIGTEVPVAKLATIDINFPRVDLPGIYYTLDGNFIKTEGSENEWDAVYVKDGNKNLFLCSNIDFIDFSALIYAEALLSNGINEYKSMGEVVKHRMNEKNLSISQILYHRLSGFDALKKKTNRFKQGISIIKYQQKTGEIKKDIGYKEDIALLVLYTDY